jgi:peptidoglycan/LPS O-acetylase OafA/YrhL
VDVFFVISGFLITSHLLREIDATGGIRLSDFWLRRAARLLPAALTVVAVVAVLAPLVLPALERDGTALQQLASLFFVQNWALVFQSVDYLAADAAPTALEHFWSLSTEEQFYLLWPLALVGIAAASRFVRITRARLVLAIGVLMAASLTLSIVLTHVAPAGAYFNTGARAWEFLAGALLCLVPRPRGVARAPLALVGAALLAVSVAVIEPSMSFPGWIAAMPVVGTMLVIAAGTPRAGTMLARVVEHPVVDYVATRSYSIYLWHWPLFILAPAAVATIAGTTVAPLPPGGLLLTLLVTIALAELTHRFLERRLRAGRS